MLQSAGNFMQYEQRLRFFFHSEVKAVGIFSTFLQILCKICPLPLHRCDTWLSVSFISLVVHVALSIIASLFFCLSYLFSLLWFMLHSILVEIGIFICSVMWSLTVRYFFVQSSYWFLPKLQKQWVSYVFSYLLV